MEIHHKLKPLHGWREFIGEVGIIVLGVLLALGAEQVVEKIHWHHQVEAGREALARDISDLFYEAKERELYSRCIARRIRDIAAILDDAQESGRLPPVGAIGNPSKRMYNLSSWEALSAAGTTAHLPSSELYAYSLISNYGRETSALNVAEFSDWSRLYAIVGPGRRIGDAEIGELRAALSEAGYRAKLMRTSTHQLKDDIKSYGLPLTQEMIRRWPDDYAALKKHVPQTALCQPLGKAPDHYGQSPLRLSLEDPVS